ncbi:hypothetical protein NDU88_009592 [Pleurodeles waltl]|uniref:Uncharacterized protein n=1 Tax=Pleurodeles waltl TaxID=8319 RepID=A0AAV7PXM5_PLEWA|nr:hypothetical protein NDU88_009592 [Pleurodeles waltl]
MLRLFPFGRTPGGFPPGVSRSPGPSSTVALVACRTLLTSLRSPGGPHRRGRSHRGSFAARLDPVEISSSKRLGRRNSRSRLRRTGARRRPGHRELRSQLGAARSPHSTGTRAPGPSAGSPSPTPHPRSKQLRQGASSSESVLPGGSGSDGHFLAPAASRERGSVSPPLTTLGPQLDGEITGMVSTAPLGR